MTATKIRRPTDDDGVYETDPDNPRRLSRREIERLCEVYRRAAWKVALQFHRRASWIDRDDLFAVTFAALGRALMTFDPSKGFRASTYATTAMWQDADRFVSIAKRQGFTFTNGANPFVVRQASGWEAAVLDDRANHVPFEVELVAAPTEVRPVEWNEEQWQRLTACLPPQWADVIVRTYRRGQTLREMSDALGVSRERVRQIRNMAIQALRRNRFDFLVNERVG